MSETITGPRRDIEQAAVECVIRGARFVSLHTMREAPDADLLHDRGFHIGVEVVQTVDQRYLDARRRIEETTEDIKAGLVNRGIAGHFYVYLDVNEILSRRALSDDKCQSRSGPFLKATQTQTSSRRR